VYSDSIFSTTFAEIVKNIDYFAEFYRKNGILVFEKLNASEEEQYEILSLLGDNLGFNPNSSNKNELKIWLRYEENHSKSLELRNQFGPHPLDDEILIHWHLEHIENDVPQVAAAWNMLKNNVSSPNNGSTGFVSCSSENLSTPDEYIDFLNRVEIKCTENTGWEMGWDSSDRRAVITHEVTGKKIIRICPLGHVQTVVSFDSTEPTREHQEMMNKINWWFLEKIWKDKSIQFWWEWSVGDLVIPDLTQMAHAVKTGFKHNQRNFVGYWAFGDGYEKRIKNPLNT
jgi:hypothetical protein